MDTNKQVFDNFVNCTVCLTYRSDDFFFAVFYLFVGADVCVCPAAVVPGLSGLHYCAWQQVPLSLG